MQHHHFLFLITFVPLACAFCSGFKGAVTEALYCGCNDMKIVQAESMPSLDLKLALFCLPALTD